MPAKPRIKKHIKKILLVYLIDILFLAAVFLFLLYARYSMQDYLVQMQNYEEQLTQIQTNFGNISEVPIEEITETEMLLSGFEKIVNKAYFFAVFVIPITLFILYLLFSTLSLNIIHGRKVFSKEYLIKIGIASIPLFLLLAYINNKIIVELGNIFYGLYSNIFLYFIALAVLIFLIILLYSSIYSCKISEIPKAFIKKAKNISNLPYFLIFLILLSLVAYLWIYLFIMMFGGRFVWEIFMLLLIAVLAFSTIKYFLFRKLQAQHF